MNIADFRVEPADYRVDFDDLRTIRETVFVTEQNIPQDLEFDKIDPDCYHVIARDNNHQAIGTARLSPEFNIERMAVARSWRGKGVGAALLSALIEKARRSGSKEVSLNSQSTVVGFYERFGFMKEGCIYNKAGIPHQKMRLVMPPLEHSERPSPKPREEAVPIIKFEDIDKLTASSCALIQEARRLLCIYSPNLSIPIYGNSNVLEALKQFAISGRGGNVHIIVHDITQLRGDSHPLINLGQRLSSTFLFRTPVEPDDLNYSSAYLINDADGYLFRLSSDKMQGVFSPNQPARNRQLMEEFDRVWQRSRPCTEFKVLGL
jgi:predicted GNAT family N-acyltransferase